jgi:signal transduction histidine kinase
VVSAEYSNKGGWTPTGLPFVSPSGWKDGHVNTEQTPVALRAQLGGPRMVTAPMWAINSCLGTGALVANVTGFGDTRDVRDVLLACALGGLLAGILSYLFHVATRGQRINGAVNLRTSLAFFSSVSAVFFASAALMCAYLDVPILESRAWQVPFQITLATFWGAFAVVILDIRDRAVASEQAAIDHLAQLERVRRAQNGLLSDIDESIRDSVNQQLQVGVEALKRHEEQVRTRGADVSSGDISRALRTISDNSVRPLSHQMAMSAASRSLKPSWFRLWRHAMDTAPLQTGSMVAILAFSLTPNEIQTFGFIRGGFAMATGLSMFAFVCVVANKLAKRFPEHHFALMMGAFTLLQVNTVISLAIRDVWRDGYLTVPQIGLHIVFSAVIVSITSTFPLWRKSRVEASDYFSRAIQQEELEAALRSSQIALATNAVARVLHGEVQSQLLSSALSIERLDPVADADQLLNTLVSARALLKAPFDASQLDDSSHGEVSVSTEVQRKANLWKGIVQVSLSLDEKVDQICGEVALNAGRVVEEAITNSVRHGRAKKVDITVEPGGYGLNILIHDNGQYHSTETINSHAKGMGTALFEAVSDGAWSMSQVDSGTVLAVTIADGRKK